MRGSHPLAAIAIALVTGVVYADDPPVRKRAEPKVTEAEQAIWDKAKAILAKADQVELYSIDPEYLPPEKRPKDGFHGWAVLGKTALKDVDTRKKVLAIAESIRPGTGAKCFDPRHAIRATGDGKTVDILLCYECGWAYVFVGDDSVHFTIAKGQEDLNAILKEAKVPLPKGPRE
ncbi:MAG TPA: hypothetical protein VHR66_07295 [Gemmataceae bacterium]|jgi:hypothetical protein|nr:hypothetical protein [Gemmataceae bacterium]